MKIDLPITPHSIKKVQQPHGLLAQARSTGMPSGKRVKEHLSSLRERIRKDQRWLALEKRGIEKEGSGLQDGGRVRGMRPS